MFDFEKILNPIDTKTFFSEYWEKRPCLISRTEPDYYSHLLSLKDIDSIIRSYGSNLSDVEVIKENSYFTPNGVVNAQQLYQAYSQGYTLRVRKISERWQPISDLRTKLQVFFNHPVLINLYMSPKNSQGFQAHFDTHEVFIVQVEGSKNWRIYDSPITLPLISDLKYQEKLRNQLTSPVTAFTLNAGDLLYIPRGYIHEVFTSDSFSTHLTVAIHTYKWFDLLNIAVNLIAQKDVRFRESLPIGFLEQGEAKVSLQEQFQELLQILADKSQVEFAVEELAQLFLGETPPPADGQFYQLENIDKLTLETIVKKRAGIYRFIKTITHVGIQFAGNTVKESNRSERAIRFILDSEEFAIKDIPGLVDNSKLNLVRRLIQEGILSTI
ncbi:cupin domain-containing protein [Microcystis aeruginosa]|uniref:Cupin 4 family protein n=1 Tax=Microcystis aeruginosa PCC 9443 TaxID=1160281 RepID=I4GA32_MICAE|nr:cupin domain-containing protein [Microcystis aeruginosa]CCI04793.1 Cupin 4 family protein [Microcystis aeruginosa PCC 9443]